MTDTRGSQGFRGDRRRGRDPDETEGRAIYRARAEGEARRSLAMARKVSYRR